MSLPPGTRWSTLLVIFCLSVVSVRAKAPVPGSFYGKENWKSLHNWQDPKFRLPRNLLPTTYAIRLLPFLVEGNFTIDGHVDIFFKCINATNAIALNSLNISIDSSHISVVETETRANISVSNFIDNQDSLQMITIETADELVPDKEYKISIKFTSYLNDELKGFFRSSYLENDAIKYIAVTHMEPANARLAFPCFDEPDMKAKFSIVLGRHGSMISASNMPLLYSNVNQNLPGYFWDYYQTSVEMSTYLVALLVAEFQSAPSDSTLSNVDFRVITRPEVQNTTEYAGQIGPQMLEFFEGYFGIDYTLSKMDMAAAPEFGPGAMENWGLMIFKEEFLLYDEGKSSAWDKQLVAEVISHELVHQWCGNLVTMKWWNNIWLNEGFARFLQTLGVEAVRPEYKINLQFPIEYLQPALKADSAESSHPMSSPEDREDIFDEIEYDKGASVLRMCSKFLGEETFRKGLNRYLSKHKFGNAVEEDLWQSLNEQADEDGVKLPDSVSQIMRTWTQEKNYPLITVLREYGNSDNMFISQVRYTLDDNGQLAIRQDDDFLWWVPLTYTQNFADQPAEFWLSNKNETLSAQLLRDHSVIFNVDQIGFYRVAYDETNYRMISKQLEDEHETISPINRAQLLDDAFNLASAGVVSYSTALNLVSYLNLEKEYYPWSGVLDEINYIDTMLYSQQIHQDWKIFLEKLIEPFYKHIGFYDTDLDDHMTFMSRLLISPWACRLGVDNCVQEAVRQYATLMDDPSTILIPNQKETILRTGISSGQKPEWDFAFDQYRNKNKVEFLIAMTYTKQPNLIYDLLDEMVSPTSAIQTKDLDVMFQNLALNPLGNSIAVQYLTSHGNAIEQTLGTDYLPRFFKYLCVIANTEAQKQQLLKLKDTYAEELGDSDEVRAGLGQVDKNLFWMEKYLDEITAFLKEPETEPTTMVSTSETMTATGTEESSTTASEQSSSSSTGHSITDSNETTNHETSSQASSTEVNTIEQTTIASTSTTPMSSTVQPTSTLAPTSTSEPSSANTLKINGIVTVFFAIILIALRN